MVGKSGFKVETFHHKINVIIFKQKIFVVYLSYFKLTVCMMITSLENIFLNF